MLVNTAWQEHNPLCIVDFSGSEELLGLIVELMLMNLAIEMKSCEKLREAARSCEKL